MKTFTAYRINISKFASPEDVTLYWRETLGWISPNKTRKEVLEEQYSKPVPPFTPHFLRPQKGCYHYFFERDGKCLCDGCSYEAKKKDFVSGEYWFDESAIKFKNAPQNIKEKNGHILQHR